MDSKSAVQGATDSIDIASFASFTAGNVAATEGFPNLLLGKRAILIVPFSERTSVELVRLLVKRV